MYIVHRHNEYSHTIARKSTTNNIDDKITGNLLNEDKQISNFQNSSCANRETNGLPIRTQ